MKVKIKKLHEDAVIPQYAKQGDGGMDLVATSKSYDENGNTVYGVGLAFEIPEGFVGLLFPRSSNAKQDLLLSNSVGVLDSGYRGEVMFKFKKSIRMVDFLLNLKIWLGFRDFKEVNIWNIGKDYNIGDRIGQIIILPYPKIEFQEVEELSDSERGAGSYGSTGK